MKKLFQNITTERYNRKKISLFTIKISWFTKERYKIVFFLIQSLKLFIRLFVRQLQAEIRRVVCILHLLRICWLVSSLLGISELIMRKRSS